MERAADLLTEIHELSKFRSELKQELKIDKPVKVYKAVKGDQVDEMFSSFLNASDLDVDVKRMGEGKYMFGTRLITCRIVNGKLLVRVGGGFMSVQEFIDHYGKMEMIKALSKAGDTEARKSFNA